MWHSSWVSGYWVNVSTKPTQQLLKQTKIVLLCCRCLANIIRMSGNRNTPISLKFLSKFCRPNQAACYRNPQRFHLISINVTSHLFTVVWRVFGCSFVVAPSQQKHSTIIESESRPNIEATRSEQTHLWVVSHPTQPFCSEHV